MATMTFDTLAYAKKLRAVGVPEAQAEVQAEAQREAIEIVVGELEARHLNDMVTKNDVSLIHKDIEVLRAELKRDIAETKKDIAETKSELIRWVVGAGFFQTVLIAALLLKLIK